jgi:hypothetical protein
LTLVSIAGKIILPPVTAMNLFFLAGNRKKWSITGVQIKTLHQSGVKVIFVLFRQRFKYCPVSPESCNAAVFLPEKSGAFSNTYVSSSP